MKLSLSDSLQEFFLAHRILELENILSEKEAALLLQHLEALCPTSSWPLGRNLWKKDSHLKSMILSSKIGEIASFLFKRKPIRLAYTEFLLPTKTPPFLEPKTLAQITCMEPILGGVFLCLEGSPAEKAPLPHLAKQTLGHAIFFSADYPVPLPEIFAEPKQKSLLICFAPTQMRYKLEPQDPCTHLLKKSGYAFGDLILKEEAPYLYH